MASGYFFQWREIDLWLKDNYSENPTLEQALTTLSLIKENNWSQLSQESLNLVKDQLQKAAGFLAEQYVRVKRL